MINIKKSLFVLVIISFLFQIIKFYSFYEEHSVWQYGDWVINYQGGFVRRGLIGELFFQLYHLTKINLDLIILIFVSLIIIINSYFLIRSLKYIYHSYINVLIFLSPGFFLYSIMNSEIIGRKDILMIFVMSFFVFFEKKFNSKNLLILLILAITTICLSHSGFIFYTPYLLFLFFIIKLNRKETIKTFEIISLLGLLIFLLSLIYFNQGTKMHVEEICLSAKNFVSEQCTLHGQIQFLQNDLNTYLYEKKTTGVDYFKSTFVYTTFFILTNFFLGLKLCKSKFKTNHYSLNKINPILIFILLFLATIPSYILALDWGRYIFISYSCSFYIFIYCFKENLFLSKYDIKINKYLYYVIIIFYSFFWTVPFYNATNFKLILKQPISSIIKHIDLSR
jgi:hypothetical protein